MKPDAQPATPSPPAEEGANTTNLMALTETDTVSHEPTSEARVRSLRFLKSKQGAALRLHSDGRMICGGPLFERLSSERGGDDILRRSIELYFRVAGNVPAVHPTDDVLLGQCYVIALRDAARRIHTWEAAFDSADAPAACAMARKLIQRTLDTAVWASVIAEMRRCAPRTRAEADVIQRLDSEAFNIVLVSYLATGVRDQLQLSSEDSA